MYWKPAHTFASLNWWRCVDENSPHETFFVAECILSARTCHEIERSSLQCLSMNISWTDGGTKIDVLFRQNIRILLCAERHCNILFINTFVEQMSQPNICEDANAKLIVEVYFLIIIHLHRCICVYNLTSKVVTNTLIWLDFFCKMVTRKYFLCWKRVGLCQSILKWCKVACVKNSWHVYTVAVCNHSTSWVH